MDKIVFKISETLLRLIKKKINNIIETEHINKYFYIDYTVKASTGENNCANNTTPKIEVG